MSHQIRRRFLPARILHPPALERINAHPARHPPFRRELNIHSRVPTVIEAASVLRPRVLARLHERSITRLVCGSIARKSRRAPCPGSAHHPPPNSRQSTAAPGKIDIDSARGAGLGIIRNSWMTGAGREKRRRACEPRHVRTRAMNGIRRDVSSRDGHVNVLCAGRASRATRERFGREPRAFIGRYTRVHAGPGHISGVSARKLVLSPHGPWSTDGVRVASL